MAFFGEGCLTVQPLRLSTATAMTDCQIMALDKAVVARAIRDEPALAVMFIAYLLARRSGDREARQEDGRRSQRSSPASRSS